MENKIKVLVRDASTPDCRRYDFYTIINGEEVTLAASALGNAETVKELTKKIIQLNESQISL